MVMASQESLLFVGFSRRNCGLFFWRCGYGLRYKWHYSWSNFFLCYRK
ncbi:hypothetical protein FHR53_003351 [Xanthomonas arboricola]